MDNGKACGGITCMGLDSWSLVVLGELCLIK